MYPLQQLLHFKFPTADYLPKVTAPVRIFHGTDDGVIPYSNAKKLEPILKKGDAFITIPEGVHNNLTDSKIVQQELNKLMQ